MATLSAANPFAFNRNNKAPIKGMARAKINVRPDKLTMTVRANSLMNRFSGSDAVARQIRFDGSGLLGEQNDAFSLDDGDFAYVMRSMANAGTGRFGGNAQRDILNNSMQAPVVTTLNGIEGATAEEIMEKIQPIGIIEMGNRDNNENAANCLVSGSVTITNKGDTNITIGDTIMVYVPLDRNNQPTLVNSNNPSEKVRGGKGRVPLVPRRVNPHDIDYTNPQKLKNLFEAYGLAANATEAAMRTAVTTLKGDYNLIDGIVRTMVAGDACHNDPTQAAPADLTDAAALLARKKLIARNYAAWLDAWLQNPALPNPTDASKRNGALANVVVEFVRTAAALKLSKERLYVGRAMMSARPGEDFELFIQL